MLLLLTRKLLLEIAALARALAVKEEGLKVVEGKEVPERADVRVLLVLRGVGIIGVITGVLLVAAERLLKL